MVGLDQYDSKALFRHGLRVLRLKNIQRDTEYLGKAVEAYPNAQALPLLFRVTELAGECGELCNEIKKIERERLGWPGSPGSSTALHNEIADVLITLDLLCMDLGIDLGAAVMEKFNATSDKIGLLTKF